MTPDEAYFQTLMQLALGFGHVERPRHAGPIFDDLVGKGVLIVVGAVYDQPTGSLKRI